MQKLDAMITVEEASKIVLEHRLTLSTEDCPIEEAIGRVLMEDLHADRDFPPYNRVAMDGIGIHFDAFANGQRVFPIQGVSAAGDPQMTLQNQSTVLKL
jgi:molybdopterin molybdotransferase